MPQSAGHLLKPSRRGSSPPFIVMDVMNAAAEAEARGVDIIHMEVGQPAAPTPLSVREAAAKALKDGQIGYTVALGLPDLRARIAAHYGEKHNLAIPMERVAVTVGSSSGFILAFLAHFEAGDRVAIATPCYPAYRNILQSLGLEVVYIQTSEDTRWSITPRMLREAHAHKPLQGLLVASPSNPTGTMMTPQALGALAEECERLGIRFISDEIYHGLGYGMEEATALSFSPDATVINSFSKYYCMTGWRIGWMVLPPSMVRPVECLAQNLFISPPKLSQIAALAAFEATDALEAIKKTYAANRAILLEGLPEAGFTDLLPVDGAFYVYANIARMSDDSMAFCQAMLEEAAIAATPGLDFDPFHGHAAMRFSFAGSETRMKDAMARLRAWRSA